MTTYGLTLKERNVLGTGRRLSFTYSKEIDRTTGFLQFSDPCSFGPYWATDLLVASNSDGYEQHIGVDRRFFSFTTPWSATLLADNLRQTERIYAAGEVASEFRQDHRALLGQYGVALLASDERASRLTVGLDWLDDRFSPLPGRPDDLLPEPRTFRYLFIAYEDVANDFVKLNYVNRDLRFEDFALGRRLAGRLALSPALLGSPRTTGQVRLEGSEGLRVGSTGFVLGQLSFDSRLDAGLSNALLSAGVLLVRRFDGRPIQTLVGRLQYNQGWRLDRDVQFFADGLSGLRGYRLHAFSGDRSLVVNVEHRLFSGWEILKIVAPSAAVFVDTGLAEPPGRPVHFSDLKSDVGVGLRFGLARASQNNVIRFDLAYAFNRDPQGRRGFLVSFGSAQAF